MSMFPVFTQAALLDAVESWATDCKMFREYSLGDNGRIDGMLVTMGDQAPMMPKFRYYPAVIGVEVKMSRADFLAGLRKEQYQRYDPEFSGLYIAVPYNGNPICRLKEIPKNIGLLVVGRRHGYGDVCICKRHPTWRQAELTASHFWGILFRMFGDFQTRLQEREARCKRISEHMGHNVNRKIAAFVKQILRDKAEIEKEAQG